MSTVATVVSASDTGAELVPQGFLVFMVGPGVGAMRYRIHEPFQDYEYAVRFAQFSARHWHDPHVCFQVWHDGRMLYEIAPGHTAHEGD